MLEDPIKFLEKKQETLHDAVPSVLVAALGIETLRMIFFLRSDRYPRRTHCGMLLRFTGMNH